MDIELKKKLTGIEKHTDINDSDHANNPISKIEIISYIDEILLGLKKQK